jgi:hypothetical protein
MDHSIEWSTAVTLATINRYYRCRISASSSKVLRAVEAIAANPKADPSLLDVCPRSIGATGRRAYPRSMSCCRCQRNGPRLIGGTYRLTPFTPSNLPGRRTAGP